jgi:hypothetical protein
MSFFSLVSYVHIGPEELPWFGGDYEIDDTVLGEAALREGAKQAIMLACGCGCFECSGVRADVTAGPETIMFSNFTTRRGGREIVAGVGPVVLDRGQVESALERLRSEVAEWRRPVEEARVGRVIVTPPPECRRLDE